MRTPGSRRDRASKREVVNNRANNVIEKTSFAYSSNTFEQLLNSLTGNSSFLYNTAEKTSKIASCINRISKDFASTDLYMTVRTSNNDYVPYKSSKRFNHPLAKPNPMDTKYTFLNKLCKGLLVEGKVYIVRLHNKGQASYYVFQGRYVRCDLDAKTLQPVYQIQFPNGNMVEVDEEDVCYIFIPGFGKNGNDVFSPVKSAIEEITLYQNLLKHQNNFSENGMMSKGFIHVSSDARLSPEQRQNIGREFTDKTSGLKASSTLVMPPGVEYVPTQNTNQEAAVLELMGWAEEAVYEVFGIPKSLFKQEFASYATADVQKSDYYKNTILPLYILVEDALNNWAGITQQRNNKAEWFQFDKKDLESSEANNAKAQGRLYLAQTMAVKQSTGLYSPNELRIQAGDEPLYDAEGNPVPEAEENPILNPTIYESEEEVIEGEEQEEEKKSFFKKTLLSEIEADLNSKLNKDKKDNE